MHQFCLVSDYSVNVVNLLVMLYDFVVTVAVKISLVC